jgi:hypothetical protein
MPKKYKITQQHSTLTGGSDKSSLIGCQIRENDASTQYELLFVVSRTPGTTLPTAPFTFPSFDFNDFTWTIGVSTMPTNAPATGSWHNTDPNPVGDQSGTWTAQSDQVDPDDLTADDASAASA